MPFRRVPMALGQEQVPAPEGVYLLTVRRVTSKKSRAGSDMDVVLFAFTEHPEYSPIQYYIVYPKDDTPEDQVRLRAREIRRLCFWFGVDWTEDGFNTDDLLGAEARVPVVVETFEPENGPPRDQNRIILERVPDEEDDAH